MKKRKTRAPYNNMEEFAEGLVNIYTKILVIDKLLKDVRYTSKSYRKALIQKRENLIRKLNNLRPKNDDGEFLAGKEVNRKINKVKI